MAQVIVRPDRGFPLGLKASGFVEVASVFSLELDEVGVWRQRRDGGDGFARVQRREAQLVFRHLLESRLVELVLKRLEINNFCSMRCFYTVLS